MDLLFYARKLELSSPFSYACEVFDPRVFLMSLLLTFLLIRVYDLTQLNPQFRNQLIFDALMEVIRLLIG